MGIKLISQKPQNPISNQWELSFPFNSTILQIAGAKFHHSNGTLTLSEPTIRDELKDNQYMSITIDVIGQLDCDGLLTKFPFPEIDHMNFVP
ncbi:hypothetical protein K7432_016767 [Basidiobolus ranarum]|uniref:Uncharacterized protein n=1 Tax=Basidiobolus ranarum TaxID=34480 RepID=A0ABR2VL64_9FUNG